MKFGQLGMGFIIDRSIEKYILTYEPLDEHMCKLRIKRTFLYFSIINILAPTENKEMAVKERFYEKLQILHNKIPNNYRRMPFQNW